MRYCQNKKSAVSGFLIMVLIITASFAIIFFLIPIILNKTSVAYADSICKGSVAIRAKAQAEIGFAIPFSPDPKFKTPPTPLFCKTSKLDLPKNKDDDSKDVKKQFANLVASCWDRYGEGLVEDVFRGEGSRAKNNCQVCYIVDTKKTSKFDERLRKEDDSGAITLQEFTQYLFTTPYPEKVFSDKEVDDCRVDGGFCINSKSECRGKFLDEKNKPYVDDSYLKIDGSSNVCKNKKGLPSCCYTKYECWNKGGICSSSTNINQYREFDGWDCPSDLKCFIKNDNHFTYGEYVQSFAGEGIIVGTANIIPRETYAISYGSLTETCDWCGPIKRAGAIGGAIVGGTLVAAGIIAAPFTFGVSLTVTAVGIGVVAGAVAGFTVAQLSSDEIDKKLAEIMHERGISTVYLTTLEQIQKEDLCSIVEST